MAEDLHSSIQSVINDDKPTVRKSLILGIGGSGMKGILAAKKWIEQNLPNEAYRYMRWIGIDTTDIETSIEGKGGRYRFPSDQFFQEERRMLYLSAPTPSALSLEYLRDKYKNDPAYSWLPNPDVYDISTRAGQGANQTRTLGRLAFFHNEEKIRKAVLKERDRLKELSNDPKYFQLMDVKEGGKQKEEVIKIQLKREIDRYYFRDYLPDGHSIISMQADQKAKSYLAPHLTDELTIDHFPKDEKGHYFEVPGDRFHDEFFSFKIRHVKRGGQISIFITCSIVGGTGNGMILDLVASLRDMFKDYWPAPRIYGILVLPSAFKRVVSNRNARGNAYAALKEIDYFMSGNTFKATYPSGRSVTVPDRLFDEGMLYLLDVENMSGNSLQGRDQVQELTGQFVSTFVASTVGGAIEERMVNDSTRASIYVPKNERSQRRAAYNSFGISRVLYPVPQLTEYGYKKTAVEMTKAFVKPVDNKLLIETIGDINRGLVRGLRLNCRLIFERMYPDYAMDAEAEFRSYEAKLKRAIEKKDQRAIIAVLENTVRDYSKEEMERIKRSLYMRMKKRYQLELEKMKTVLLREIHGYLKDPNKGFLFAETVINMVLEKLEIYQKKYYKEKVGLARYSQKELEAIIEKIDSEGLKDIKMAQAVIEMARFNFSQLLFETMLTASEDFVREFKALLFKIKNEEVTILKDKVLGLLKQLEADIGEIQFELLERKNPLFFYLINQEEIDRFLETYFYSRLSIEDLCNDVDFLQMDRGDDVFQMVETFLLSSEGLEVLEMSTDELKDLIKDRFGDILTKTPEEAKDFLYHESAELDDGFNLSEAAVLKIDIENLRSKIFQIIHTKFKGFNFESLSIRDVLEQKQIPLRRLLEKLDHFSRPYIYLDGTGTNSIEYYRTITNFELNTYETGDNPEKSEPNDLPSRLDHYVKRDNALPKISVETFTVPNFCKPYEIISIGILIGYPAYKINSLAVAAKDYHSLIQEKSHPLHLFNSPDYDARYFPDPFRLTNYLNPARLFKGLVMFKGLLKGEDEVYRYEKSLHERLKDMEAREQYKQVILDYDNKVKKSGGFQSCPIELLVEGINAMAMLIKHPKSGKMQFRREYSIVIRDILDGDGTGDKAREAGMSKDRYIEKHIPSPEFENNDGLIYFLETEIDVREFLIENMTDIIEKTKETMTSGAEISLPRRMRENVELPEFADKHAFFDYFEAKGSLEWQNLLKNHMVNKLDKLVKSSRFRLESDPTLLDRSKVGRFLESLATKLPEIVLWEVKVQNKLIK